MVCKKGNADDLAYVWQQTLKPDGFSPELRQQALSWLADAAKLNNVVPSGDLKAVTQLFDDPQAKSSPEFMLAAMRLAAIWKVPGMATHLQKIIASPDTALPLKKTALSALVSLDDAESAAILKQIAEAEGPVAFRMEVAAALTRLDADAAAQVAGKLFAQAAPSDDSGPLVEAFLIRQGGPEKLAVALAEVNLPTDVAKRALRAMYAAGRNDAPLADVLGKAAGIGDEVPPPTGDDLARLCEEVLAKGDSSRGEQIFRRTELNCMKCHSVSGGGGNIGPDLSPVGGTSPIDYVVSSILDPSRAIKEQFVTRNFVTSEGQVLSGIVVDRNEKQITLKDATGKIVVIPADDIEDEAEGKSLMPEGLTRFLTHQELLDLAKFISELGKPGPYAVRTRQTVQRWRVLREPAEHLVREVPNIEILREGVVNQPEDAWLPAFGKVGGALPLEELRQATGQRVLYLQGSVEVKQPGPIQVQITSPLPTQAWIGATPMQDHQQFTNEFNAGLYTVTIRVELPEEPTGELTLEFTKPEGSSAQFVAQ
jgi:putative heme-binding domain-containing protein